MNQLQLFSAQVSHHTVDCQRYLRRLGELDRAQQEMLARLRALALRRHAIVVVDDAVPEPIPPSRSQTVSPAVKRPKRESHPPTAMEPTAIDAVAAEEEAEFMRLVAAARAISMEKASLVEQVSNVVEEMREFMSFRMLHFRVGLATATEDSVRTPLKKP